METILLTLLSIVIGGLIAFRIAKWQVKRKKIVHFGINSYDIGKGLSDEFPEFNLSYNGKPLSDNVGVLNGGFINVGRNDIIGLKGNSDIELVLPEKITVKAVVISESSDGLDVNVSEDKEHKNIINFGINELLKTDEYFKYTIIVESSNDITIEQEEPKIRHRIPDTDIKQMYLGVHREFRRRKMLKFYKIIVLLVFLLGLLLIPISMFNDMETKYIDKCTGEEVQILIDYNSNIHVKKKGNLLSLFEGKKITKKELEDNYRTNRITTFNPFNLKVLFSWGFWIFTILYILLSYYYLFMKYLGGDNRHIINVLYPSQKTEKK